MSSGRICQSTLDHVCWHIPTEGDGVTPKQVREQVKGWSKVTIYRALRELCDQGSVVYFGVTSRRRYRRVHERFDSDSSADH